LKQLLSYTVRKPRSKLKRRRSLSFPVLGKVTNRMSPVLQSPQTNYLRESIFSKFFCRQDFVSLKAKHGVYKPRAVFM
jgi:hypothetical protein